MPTDAQTRSSSKACWTPAGRGLPANVLHLTGLGASVLLVGLGRVVVVAGLGRPLARPRARRMSSTAGRRRAPCRSTPSSPARTARATAVRTRRGCDRAPRTRGPGTAARFPDAAPALLPHRARAAPTRRIRSSAPGAKGRARRSHCSSGTSPRACPPASRARRRRASRSAPMRSCSTIASAASGFAADSVPQNGQTSRCRAGFQTASPPHAGQANFVSATVSAKARLLSERGGCSEQREPLTRQRSHGRARLVRAAAHWSTFALRAPVFALGRPGGLMPAETHRPPRA